MTNSTTGPAGNPTYIKRAVALWTYISDRSNRFSIGQALEVIDELAPTGNENPKEFAWRLREALSRRRIWLKHTHAVDAAAKVLRGVAWHNLQRDTAVDFLTVYTFPDLRGQGFNTWHKATIILKEACVGWCANHPTTKVLRLVFNRNSISIVGSGSGASKGSEFPREESIVIVTASGERPDWMAGAGSAFEDVRRALEEAYIAVLDGYALLEFCSDAAREGDLGVGPSISTSDVVTSEIILMRDDYDIGPSGAFEMARGDEVYCWSQLDLALEGKAQQVDDEDGAWRAGDARFVWQIATIHPKAYVPGLITSQRVGFGKKMFRRYKLAQRILGDVWPRRHGAKHIADLEAPAESCRVNLHKLLHAMKDVGLDWESYCAEVGEPIDLRPVLPMGFVMGLLERLRPDEPNQLFGMPPRAELVRATDDYVLRALMPRAQRARYRLPEAMIKGPQREVLIEAIDDFSASLALRSGLVQISDPLPDLVYGSDGEELRLKLEEMGLVVYFGLVPYLHKLPEEALNPGVFPYAFGHALYLDIDHAG